MPAGGFGVRMTPTWNISEPETDFVAKPAIAESFSGRTLLDITLDNLFGSEVISSVLVRVGDTPERIEQEPSEFLRRMKEKARLDVLAVLSRRRHVSFFHNNPDGSDDGTGATILSREAKRMVSKQKGVKNILIIASDLPTVSSDHIKRIVRLHLEQSNDITISCVYEEDPSGHGRIVRYPMMLLGLRPRDPTSGSKSKRKADRLSRLMASGRIAVLELPDARCPPGHPWAKHLVLDRRQIEEIERGGVVRIPHPLRGVVRDDGIEVDAKVLEALRLRPAEGFECIWDERSGQFLAIVEQSQIGGSRDERSSKGSVSINGFELPLSTDYLHSIRERNVLCMVVSGRVFDRTIRDLDAINYGRIVEVEGKAIAVPNSALDGGDGWSVTVDDVKISLTKVRASTRCVKLNEYSGGYYVLERHEDGEYYLPEVVKEVISAGGRVGIYELPVDSAEGIDSRTDLRRLSEHLMLSAFSDLASSGVDVSGLNSLRALGGIRNKELGKGSKLAGFVHLAGRVRAGPGAEIRNSFVESADKERTTIGKCARIISSIVKNSTVGAGSVIENSVVEGVKLPSRSSVRNTRVSSRRGKGPARQVRVPDANAKLAGLTEAEEVEIEAIEQVFGVTVHPGSAIFLSSDLKEALLMLADAVKRAGGPKELVPAHPETLRRGAWSELIGPRLRSMPQFRIGPNSQLTFRAGLSVPVGVASGAMLEDSVVCRSEIGGHALVRLATLADCRVESSASNPTRVVAETLAGQVIEEGYPHGNLLDCSASAHPIQEWLEFLGEPTSTGALVSIYGEDLALAQERREKLLALLDVAARRLGHDANVVLLRVPGRVNLMGRHVDHRGGHVNPIAIPREVLIAAEPREDSLVAVFNANQDFAEFSFDLLAEGPKNRIASLQDWRDWTQSRLDERRKRGLGPDWSEYCKAAVYLQNYFMRSDGSLLRRLRGANMVLSGDIPMSVGLSSSSAIVVGTFFALSTLNDLRLSDNRFVELCGEGEWFVGTRGGCGDQAAMTWARRHEVCHIGFFPLSVSWFPFPSGLKVVVCNSLVEARKTAEAKTKFNEKVATYELALFKMLDSYPDLAGKVKHLRDLNPASLRVSLPDFYRMLKTLPVSASREELRRVLASRSDEIERYFREHSEPGSGYELRGVALFGIAECERSRIAPQVLARDPRKFGEMMVISHNGDREFVHVMGERQEWSAPVDDRYLEGLARRARGRIPDGVKLHMQPGRYGCGHESTDLLVDVALSSPGVLGAQLVGAGLGGCVVALVKRQNVGELLDLLATRFYGSGEKMRSNVIVCDPIQGISSIRLRGRRPTFEPRRPHTDAASAV